MPRPASTRAWASANAGMRWPPVPPPAINTFMGAPRAEFGMRNAEYKGRVEGRNETRTAIPHSAFRTPHLVHSAFRIPHSALLRSPPPPHAHQHPGRDEGDEQAGPPVRDEWQRDARGREERERYADVQHRGDPDHPCESHREQPAERIAGRLRHAETEPGERAEQHDH